MISSKEKMKNFGKTTIANQMQNPSTINNDIDYQTLIKTFAHIIVKGYDKISEHDDDDDENLSTSQESDDIFMTTDDDETESSDTVSSHDDYNEDTDSSHDDDHEDTDSSYDDEDEDFIQQEEDVINVLSSSDGNSSYSYSLEDNFITSPENDNEEIVEEEYDNDIDWDEEIFDTEDNGLSYCDVQEEVEEEGKEEEDSDNEEESDYLEEGEILENNDNNLLLLDDLTPSSISRVKIDIPTYKQEVQVDMKNTGICSNVIKDKHFLKPVSINRAIDDINSEEKIPESN